MPVTPTYPGVYIEELPSGVHSIAGVATSIAAFVGYFKRGAMKKAVQIFNYGDFEREFGGLDIDSEASYAIQQFFLNGGTQAYVVRTAAANSAVASAIALKENTAAGSTILKATALSEGKWGDNVRIDIDYNTTDPATTFNLTVIELVSVGGKLQPGQSETFRNLIIDATKSNDAKSAINNGSRLIQVDYMNSPTPTQRPAQTGTISKTLVPADLTGLAAADAMDVFLNGGASIGTVTLAAPLPTTPAALAGAITAQLRALAPLSKASVSVLGSASTQQFLQIKSGTNIASDVLTFTGTLATKLDLIAASSRSNVQQYRLGSTVSPRRHCRAQHNRPAITALRPPRLI